MNGGARAPDGVERFRRLIRAQGPIPIALFMGESNALYYASRDPLGSAGDFVTAPEISQMFGEMIGIALADVWNRAGRPLPIAYVELGPGRGTLAADALRVMARLGLQPQAHLVEASPALRASQARAVAGAGFHDDVSTLPQDMPLLVVANEFFDALPVRQLVRTGAGWRERMVGLEDDALVFVAGDAPMDAAVPEGMIDAGIGTIIETCPAAAAVMRELAGRLAAQGGAALAIDYGYAEHRWGSTLQAVKAHRKVDPLAHPGNADLTAHVDFAMLGEVARQAGSRTLPVTGQGAWLAAMGIDLRRETLSRATPERAGELATAQRRLTHPDEMGALFRVLGLAAPGWPDCSGFEEPDPRPAKPAR